MKKNNSERFNLVYFRKPTSKKFLKMQKKFIEEGQQTTLGIMIIQIIGVFYLGISQKILMENVRWTSVAVRAEML